MEYQVLPPMCDICHVFGHHKVKCANKTSTSSLPSQHARESPSKSATQTQIGRDKHVALEHTPQDPIHQLKDSSKSSPLMLQEVQAGSLIDTLSESESEEELMEGLEGVVRSSQEADSQPQSKLEITNSGKEPSSSIVPRDGMITDLNHTLSPKPPDPQVSEVRDEAIEEDLKGNFQKVISRSAQRRQKKLAREQPLSSLSRRRN